MARDRRGSLPERNGKEEERDEDEEHEEDEEEREAPSKRDHGRKSKRKKESEADDDDPSGEEDRKISRNKKTKKKKKVSRRSSRRRYSDEDSSYSSSPSDSSDSESDSSYYSSEDSENEDERRRRKRKERQRRKEKEERRRRKREKEKEKKRRKKDKDKERKERKKKEGKKGAVTNSWGKYGILRETDMWNKRPEFTAWLLEVKQVNLETLSNREEKQMFKEFMEDHNTATFPSKKYYSLDAYHKRKMDKEMKKGFKRVLETERTVFNDEEIRRQELMLAREKQKEEQVEALKLSMQTGMAQAMKEQAQLREEMAYQYKLGNFEAAAAIQRRLDPDVAM